MVRRKVFGHVEENLQNGIRLQELKEKVHKHKHKHT